MTLGQRIQELRKGAGLSQEGLGEKLGVSRQAVSKWESDGGIPELDTLIAMSKLFGVTIGQLLGVEEPEGADGETRAEEKSLSLNEEQVEAILRRYVEETRQAPQKSRYDWKAPLIAVAGLAALVVFIGVKLGSANATISNISSRLSYLESNLNNLSGQIGGMEYRIQSILADQNDPVSSFDWWVTGFDPEPETVTVELRTTLKSYTPETKACFEAVCSTVGENKATITETLESDWVSGPDFVAEMTLPMNFHTEFTLRLELPDGTLQRQALGTAYSGMQAESFELFSDNIIGPAGISNSKGVVKQVEPMYIYSGCPELFWPVYASLELEWQSTVVQEPARTASMELELTAWDSGQWRAVQAEGKTTVYEISNGSVVTATLTVTDNLGRVFTLTESGTVSRDGKWIVTAETPPISN